MVFFRHGYVRLTCDLYDPKSNNLTAHLTNQVSSHLHTDAGCWEILFVLSSNHITACALNEVYAEEESSVQHAEGGDSLVHGALQQLH